MSIFPWLVWRCDCGQTPRRAGLRLKHPDGNHSPLEGESAKPAGEPVGGLPLNPKQSERAAKAVLKHHEANHSPLEGESARPGRSPPSIRWGGNETRLHPTNTGKSRAPTPVWMCWRRGTRRWLAPHRISRQPGGSASATPPQGGSDGTVDGANAILPHSLRHPQVPVR